jgi:glycosyltransferase involved in cell wall biosynthesis
MNDVPDNKAEVSIIITAYNRTEFCLDAISSVLNQDKLANKCEIIVVKNFYKIEIDNLILANNIISIFKDNCNLGEMLRTAISAASGELLCFLDDDDLFNPTKIHHVIKVFREVEGLNYYHHSQDIRDVNMVPLKTIYTRNAHPGKLLVKASEAEKHFYSLSKKHILLSSFFFNLSSITIRKEIIMEKLDDLSQIVTHPEDFMFFAALTYNEKSVLLHENLNLTIYRSHDSLSNIQIGSKTSILDRKKNLIEKDLKSTYLILKMCSGHRNLESILKMRISYENYIYAVLTKNKTALLKEFRYLALKNGLGTVIRRPISFYVGTPVLCFAIILASHSDSSSIVHRIVDEFITKIL